MKVRIRGEGGRERKKEKERERGKEIVQDLVFLGTTLSLEH